MSPPTSATPRVGVAVGLGRKVGLTVPDAMSPDNGEEAGTTSGLHGSHAMGRKRHTVAGTMGRHGAILRQSQKPAPVWIEGCKGLRENGMGSNRGSARRGEPRSRCCTYSPSTSGWTLATKGIAGTVGSEPPARDGPVVRVVGILRGVSCNKVAVGEPVAEHSRPAPAWTVSRRFTGPTAPHGP